LTLAAACALLPWWSAAQEHQLPSGEEAIGAPGEESSHLPDDLIQIIEDYFEALADGGYLSIYDEATGQTLKLDRPQAYGEVRKTGDDSFALCVDARTADDHLYDLDFFIEKQRSGLGIVVEVAIHKDAEQVRYIWEQQNGVWSRKTMN